MQHSILSALRCEEGGSINFVSVARTLEPPESLLLIATAASHVAFAIWFAFSIWIGQRWGSPDTASGGESRAQDQPQTHKPLSVYGLALFWGVGVLLASRFLEVLLARVPSILVLTTVALIVAQ